MITIDQIKSAFQEIFSTDLTRLDKKVAEASKVWDEAGKNFAATLWTLRVRRLRVPICFKPLQWTYLIYTKEGFFTEQAEIEKRFSDWSSIEILQNLQYLPLLIEKAQKEIQTLNDLTKPCNINHP